MHISVIAMVDQMLHHSEVKSANNKTRQYVEQSAFLFVTLRHPFVLTFLSRSYSSWTTIFCFQTICERSWCGWFVGINERDCKAERCECCDEA